MFIPSVPGQRESSVANTETQVSIPVMQFLAAGMVCSLLGVSDLMLLWCSFMRAGSRATWFVIGIVILVALFAVAYLSRNSMGRYRNYLLPALMGLGAFAEFTWLTNGYQIIVENWPLGLGMYDLPIMLLVVWLVVTAPFHYFAAFLCFGLRNDMSDRNWPPTRRPLPGEYGPVLPGTLFKPITTATDTRSTVLLTNDLNGQVIELDNGRKIPLYDALILLRASEHGNHGLTLEVAESTGMKREIWKDLVHFLQTKGLATPNGQGKVSRLIKASDLVLRDLGFNVSDGKLYQEPVQTDF